MRGIVFFLLLLFFQSGSSQNLQDLKKACEKENTAKSWNNLAQYYYKNESGDELLKEAADTAYKLALEENNNEEIGAALMLLAEVDYSGQWDEYINQNRKALEYLDKAKNPKLQVEAWGNIGYAFNVLGQYDEAITHFKEAGKFFPKLVKDKDKIIATIFINMGFAYLYKGQIDSTLYYISEARESATIAKDTAVLIACNDQLGIIHRRKGDFSAAISYFDESLRLYESVKNDKAICATLLNIANIYNESRMFDKALYFVRESAKYALRYPKEKHNLGRVLSGLGSILNNNGKYEDALDTLLLAEPLLQENNYDKYINYLCLSNSYFQLNRLDSADIYMQRIEMLLQEDKRLPAFRFYADRGAQLGKSGRYAEAIPFLEKFIEKTHNIPEGHLFGEYEKYNLLALSLEKAQRDYKQALFYKNIAFNYRDSLYKEEQSRIVNDFLVKYQTAEKDLQISMLNQQQQKMRYNRMLMIGVFVIVVVLLLSIWLYNRLQVIKRDKEALELNKKIEEKDNNYQLLLNDIELRQMKHYLTGLETERERLAKELHDNISNNLFVLDMELKANKQIPEDVHLQIEKLYTQVRSISHDLMPPAFQYASLYEALDSYLDELNEQSDVYFELIVQNPDIEIPQKIAFEVYRIIQEITSNIMKHSHARLAKVTVSQAENSSMILTIEDDGRGFDIQKRKKGIGLQIIVDRCRSINGSLEVKSEIGKGCKIIIIIPLSPQDYDV